jgi:hypothetical protein
LALGAAALAAGAGVTAGAGAAVSVFLAILFDLLWETEEDISHALGILYDNVTCLNHKLYNPLIIIKHGWNGSEQSFKIESRTLEIMYK